MMIYFEELRNLRNINYEIMGDDILPQKAGLFLWTNAPCVVYNQRPMVI